MKLIIKFPSRARTEQFFKVLDTYYSLLADLENTYFIISCDLDDYTMNNEIVRDRFKKYKNLEVNYGNNKSKIEAVNADINNNTNFDVLLLASDDMVPQLKGYDNIIREKMQAHYPDTDGVLWFNDGYQAHKLNTLCILGKKYYLRFGYIYHPAYKSLWCDNEFMEVANILGKQQYFDQIIIKHMHPDAIDGISYDELYQRNLKLDSVDKKAFLRRKKNKFDLEPKPSLFKRIFSFLSHS